MPPDPGPADDPDAYVAEWLDLARRDLTAAEVLVDSEAEPLLALVEVQQAIEKALKGFLISQGWELERTHDVTYLLDEAQDRGPDLARYRELCDVSTKAYLDARYPGRHDADVDRDTARSLVAEARELVDRLEAAAA